MARIGYLSNGGAWLTAYDDVLNDELRCTPHVFDTSKRWTGRLSKVDVLLVPWAPDAIWIATHRTHLIRFLRGGGVIVAFGEFDSDWLPNMIWTKTIEDTVCITDVQLSLDGDRARRKIFANLSDTQLSGWADTCHGYFRALPAHVDVLVTNRTHNAVMVFDGNSFKGAILASSIDPDFHTYARNSQARVLFRQIVEWALMHVGEEGGYRRELRVPRLADFSEAVAPVLPAFIIETLIAVLIFLLVTLMWK